MYFGLAGNASKRRDLPNSSMTFLQIIVKMPQNYFQESIADDMIDTWPGEEKRAERAIGVALENSQEGTVVYFPLFA